MECQVGKGLGLGLGLGGTLEGCCSILSLSCFMWSGALDSPGVLLSYSTTTLA